MPDFPSIRFGGTLRPSQNEVVAIARRQLESGERQLHVVAPPGSGKTVMGLYLWAECIRLPALVLSPNSAIQAQWTDRLALFDIADNGLNIASTAADSPSLFTSLTYQSVTLPHRGDRRLDAEATELWIEKLVERGLALDPDEATIWIDDLKRHNRPYYDERLAGYRKDVRDEIATGGEALKTLHASALATLDRLKTVGIGLIILDECHHLLNHWGRVLADVHRYFDHPIVIGLTATPPDLRGKNTDDVDRYETFFGPVDYEVPVPAVVKDGFLAPYQDLVQLVRPTADELNYIANADDKLYELVEQLCKPRSTPADAVEQPSDKTDLIANESLTDWLVRVLADRHLAVGTAPDWKTFVDRDPRLAWAGPRFLISRNVSLPLGVPQPTDEPSQVQPLAVMIPVLTRYIRRLRRSHDPSDQETAEDAIQRLRMLGTQVTETGSQACASPISRILAYAQGKTEAILPILRAERAALGESIRAVVVADYEKTSAVTAEISHLLDEEAGGAVAAFRMLLTHPETDELDPILVTGSTVLVDDDLAAKFDAAAQKWLAERNYEVELEFGEEAGFHTVSGRGADWCPRTYVAMVTELFQSGLTKCLVGTRGLLGEGWDASKTNVLIDLTTVTTSTSVNQLRGRSLRLDPDDPKKVAHNWDVICIAPEFVKGLDDYRRFIAKHNNLYGVTDDGVIEKGVGHVHAAFTEVEAELVEESMSVLNEEMLSRPTRREEFRKLWRIGEPYHADPIATVELQLNGAAWSSPPDYAVPVADWTPHSLTQTVGRAILGALQEAGLVKADGALHIEERAGGYIRAFLENAAEDDSRLFNTSLEDVLGPLDRPRYVIRRFVDYRVSTWISRLLPEVLGRYFRRKRSHMEMVHAVPRALAKNKQLAAIFGRHWNTHVSKGQPIFVRSQEGQRLVEQALQDGRTPMSQFHHKDVFV